MLEGEFTSIGMIENDQAFVSITNTNFISSWTRARKCEERRKGQVNGYLTPKISAASRRFIFGSNEDWKKNSLGRIFPYRIHLCNISTKKRSH